MNWRNAWKMARFTQRVELSFHKIGLKGSTKSLFLKDTDHA